MPKQNDLPGVEGPGVSVPRIKALDDLAEDYQKEKKKRCAQTPKEVAAKGKLIDAIHKHADRLGRTPEGEIIYQNDELIITLAPGPEKLKVKDITDEEEE